MGKLEIFDEFPVAGTSPTDDYTPKQIQGVVRQMLADRALDRHYIPITPEQRLQNSIRTLNVRIRNTMDEREKRALIAVRDAMRAKVPAREHMSQTQ